MPEPLEASELLDSCSEPSSGLFGSPGISFSFLFFLGLPFNFGAKIRYNESHGINFNFSFHTYLDDYTVEGVPPTQDSQMFPWQT